MNNVQHFSISKIPIVATPLAVKDIFLSLYQAKAEEDFKDKLSDYLNLKYIFLLNSATSSAFIILKVLKKISDKNEVILPAYTASPLITAIKKAGLKPVLCDISLGDFNMDLDLLPSVVSKNTLCILGVHMFGIVANLNMLKSSFPDIFVIEDCAQSFGSKIDGIQVGNLADISFFSFNRGKNLPTYGGGCIATNSKELTDLIANEIKDTKGLSIIENISIVLRVLALSIVVRPLIYGLSSCFISQFKEAMPSEYFAVKKYTDFQSAVALSILKNIDEFSRKRYCNGMRLIEGFSGIDGLILPHLPKNTQPAFNRLPILFKDLGDIEKIKTALWKCGIESSRMYFRPLHHIFDLGYKKEDFPNANYFAEHLLTLPVHPLVTEEIIEKMIGLIREILK